MLRSRACRSTPIHATSAARGSLRRHQSSPARRERGCGGLVFVDPFGTELYAPLAASPLLDVVGGDFHRLVALAPTTIMPGEAFDALAKAEDLCGNPCERFTGVVTLHSDGVE